MHHVFRYDAREKVSLWKSLEPILKETLASNASFEFRSSDTKSGDDSKDDEVPPGFAVISTSGTTGEPKKVRVHLPSRFVVKAASGTRKTWLTNYPLNRWAFIDLACRSVLKGDHLVFTGGEKLSQLGFAGENEVTSIAMTPSSLMFMLNQSYGGPYQNVREVVMGGEHANQRVLDLASESFPNAKITHTYASTETGLIASTSDQKEGYPLTAFSGDLFFMRSDDELIYNGIETGDLWAKTNDRFHFIGRKDSLLDVFGFKVNTFQYSRDLEAGLGLRDVEVGRLKSPYGNVLGLAFVGSLSEEEVLAQIRSLYPKHMWPARICKLDLIPVNDTGKRSIDWERI